jgi:hypothetical protein
MNSCISSIVLAAVDIMVSESGKDSTSLEITNYALKGFREMGFDYGEIGNTDKTALIHSR